MVRGNSRMGEFEIIERYFAPLTEGDPLASGLADDAALVDVPDGQSLVATKDMMVSGRHFLPDDPADLIGRKLLRANLSDLAAMGATPKAYLLGIALPDSIDEDWVAAFSGGLAEDQLSYGLHLIGGDTVATAGQLTLSLTALGTVKRGCAINRSGARIGDDIYVSGTVGDGSLGLKVVLGDLEPRSQELIDRYRLPRPRLALGRSLAGLATAAADISDGLVADLGHICKASGIGATILEVDVPLSPSAQSVLEKDPTQIDTVLTGGDDYELIFSAPPSVRHDLLVLASSLDLAITRIGCAESVTGVRVMTGDNSERELMQTGFTHL